jgi:hypothetical protein
MPVDLQQKTPRRFRLSAMGVYYLLGSLMVSIALLTFVIGFSIHDAKLIKNGKELEHEGRLIYTDDVKAGGGRQATVFYSFTYQGETYRSSAYLPKAYLSLVERYSKSGSFPVIFLPNNPSVNHPNDWHDTESLPWLKHLFVFLVFVQWCILFRLVIQDLRLIRKGIAVVGRVTSCRLSRNGGIVLKYEFRDMEGQLTEGRGEYPAPKKKDAQICVLYLPEQPWKSRPYPLVFFRAGGWPRSD